MQPPELLLEGAGPGDPKLVTLKVIKALQSAAVILYDALANQALLDYTPADAIKVFAGKRFGCHALSQAMINQLMIDYIFSHKRVVRLKGGDSFVFGRAQVKIEAARQAGIRVKLIPGISSAQAVPASQMIPLTCRGVSEGFWVTTDTTRAGDLSPDIKSAAQSSATVIILMAMNKLEAIVEIFCRNGKSETPVAITQEGTTEKEKIVIGTVKDICLRAQYEGSTNPAVIVVGHVVKLHPALLRLHWSKFQFIHTVPSSKSHRRVTSLSYCFFSME
jgi:uroporphyrin-III C-methyltransferase